MTDEPFDLDEIDTFITKLLRIVCIATVILGFLWVLLSVILLIFKVF